MEDPMIVPGSIVTEDERKVTNFDENNINSCNSNESVDTNLITFLVPPKNTSISTMDSDVSPVDSDSGLLMTDSEQMNSSTPSPPPVISGNQIRSPRFNLNMTRPFSAQETNLFAFAVPLVPPMPKHSPNAVSSGSLGLNVFVNSNLLLQTANSDEEKFVSAHDFADTMNANDWDALLGSNVEPVCRDSRWDRESLYQRFDPLLNRQSPPKGVRKPREVIGRTLFSSSLVEDELDFFGNVTKKSLTTSVSESDVLVVVDEEDESNMTMRAFGEDNEYESRDVTIVENFDEVKNTDVTTDHILAQLNFESALCERDERIQDLEERLTHQISICSGHETLKYQLDDSQNQRRLANLKIDEYKLNLMTREHEKLTFAMEYEQLANDLRNVETAFNDVHAKYERVKCLLEHSQKNEELLIQRDKAMQIKIATRDAKLDEIHEVVSVKLETMFQTYEAKFKTMDGDNSRLRAQLRKAEMKIEAMENDARQKEREIAKLNGLCDDLILKRGE